MTQLYVIVLLDRLLLAAKDVMMPQGMDWFVLSWCNMHVYKCTHLFICSSYIYIARRSAPQASHTPRSATMQNMRAMSAPLIYRFDLSDLYFRGANMDRTDQIYISEVQTLHACSAL